MKKKDAVFQLIKSLSRGEKRNFRMLAQLTSGSKKYLLLFDVMDSLDEYDEARILRRFRKDPSFEKQFAYNKNYLYNSILNSLAYFHKSTEAELSSLGLQVKILLEKNLYSHAKKLIRKTKEKAMRQEKFEEVLRLFNYEIEILKATENIKLLKDKMRQLEFEERLILEKIENLIAYRRLDSRIFVLLKTRMFSRNPDEDKEVQELLADPLFRGEEQALSVRAKIWYNRLLRGLAFYIGEREQAYEHSARAIELFEGNPELMDELKIDYLNQVSLFTVESFFRKEYENSYRTLVKTRNIRLSSPQERVFRFNRFYLTMLYIYLETGATEGAEELIANIEKELGSLDNELGEASKLQTYYFLAYYWLQRGDPSRALTWNNKLLNHPRTNLRADIQAANRLLNLLIHIELGNLDLVEYTLKSTYRFIYKNERMNKYERRVLRFVKEAINSSSKELDERLIKFRDDIKEIFEDPYEKRAANLFDMLAWIETKRNGRPFLDVVKDKFGVEFDAIIRTVTAELAATTA